MALLWARVAGLSANLWLTLLYLLSEFAED